MMDGVRMSARTKKIVVVGITMVITKADTTMALVLLILSTHQLLEMSLLRAARSPIMMRLVSHSKTV